MIAHHAISRVLARAARTEVGIAILVATTLISLLVFTVAIVIGFRQSAAMVDELGQASERQLIVNYLDQAGKTSVAQQKVQLIWDDAFKAVGHGRDFAWADVYLGDFFWTNFRYEQLYLVDPQGRLIRAWSAGRPSGESGYREIAGEVRRRLAAMAANGSVHGEPSAFRRLEDASWPFDDKGRPLMRWSKALVDHRGTPALLTVAAIIPDTDFSLLRRTPNHLVALRRLDTRFLADMGQSLMLSDVAFARRARSAPGVNTLALGGEGSERLGWLSWNSPPRSEMMRGRVRPMFLGFLCLLAAVIGGALAIVRALVRAMRDLRAREAQSKHMALHDAMTGLPNRTQFYQKLAAALATCEQDATMVIVAYFDLDNFKYVNDTEGHQFGDELIQQVARRCRSRMCEGEVLARFGGDEFVLMRIVPRFRPAVRQLGEDMMAIFAAPLCIDGRLIDITSSCGISWAPDHGDDADDLIRNADIALYRAKQRGRARWRAFVPAMKEAIHRRHGLEVHLRHAIASDELSVVYQPIVRAEDGAVAGIEALLRWRQPQLGQISPATFVPIAEQSGLMQPLGWWMLRRVFTECRAWPGEEISVNLSPLQLMARGFVDELRELTAELGIDPRRITLEVTEGVLMERGDGVFGVLHRLKDVGFGIALDDFGTGYSSLSYLRMFHFDRIKIDRSFVQNIENDLDGQAILKAIVALGRSLKMKIVAEGVETPLQRQLVVAAGCELIQGHLYWRAMPAEEVGVVLAGGRARRALAAEDPTRLAASA